MIARTGFYFDVFRTFRTVFLVAIAIAVCLTAQAHADEPFRPEYVGSETCAASASRVGTGFFLNGVM